MHLQCSRTLIIAIILLLITIDTLFAKKIENDCKHCRILTDSINHWYKKTSRGKFEGGDAAWEEANLKSYARSEIRLVEIQEGLCSEVKKQQDHCYRLAEKAEQAIEKWWYNDDVLSGDIYTWLCIDTLQHCCPQSHYGDTCTPCPIGKNNEVCSGNGHCNGEGTRTGNGQCVCRKHFTGEYCDRCAKNFYSSESGCEPCHKTCEGCNGGTDQDCLVCRTGWLKNNGKCVDIDECLDLNICQTNQYCINTEGSHVCTACHESCATCKGSGISNCTSCSSGNDLWSSMCVDENLKNNLLGSILKRMFLYLGLFVIIIFIYRRSTLLASLVLVLIAIYIYINEKTYTLTHSMPATRLACRHKFRSCAGDPPGESTVFRQYFQNASVFSS